MKSEDKAFITLMTCLIISSLAGLLLIIHHSGLRTELDEAIVYIEDLECDLEECKNTLSNWEAKPMKPLRKEPDDE